MDSLWKVSAVGLAVRLAVIGYGQWHDENLEVPFTDIDYKVFTDAARHVVEGDSPYARKTYRYPPLLAWLLVPNVLHHAAWGKLVFALGDILTGVVIHSLVGVQGYPPLTCLRCAMVWVLNPLAVIISTRGNSDSLTALTVLLSVLLLLRDHAGLAGVVLALAIHIRLYPILFALPMYLVIRTPRTLKHDPTLGKLWQHGRTLFWYMFPNRSQLRLTAACVITLYVLTVLCYKLYGWQFLDEYLLYHFKRIDTRHNFSVFFYLLYLNPNQPSFLITFPPFLLILVFSFVFGNRSNILFCLFAQTFVLVSYNTVLTSQYFIWYLSLLPPNLPRLRFHLRQAAVLTSLWVFAQLTWLIPAYLLEFRGKDTFLYIWFQGVGFFCANVAVLVRLIRGYKFKIKEE